MVSKDCQSSLLKYVFFAIAVFGILAGCARDPIKEYNLLLANPSDDEPTNVADAISNASVTALQKGERAKFEFDANDAKINLDGISSFYQVFEARDTPGVPFEIKTFSHVKIGPAGGFGQTYVVWPRVFILDDSGAVLTDTSESGEVNRGGDGALQYVATWTAQIPQSGKCYVLVTSDNRYLGMTVAEDAEVLHAGTISFPWVYGLRAHPTGVLTILWQ